MSTDKNKITNPLGNKSEFFIFKMFYFRKKKTLNF